MDIFSHRGFSPSIRNITRDSATWLFICPVALASCLSPSDCQTHSSSAHSQNAVPLSAWLHILQPPAVTSFTGSILCLFWPGQYYAGVHLSLLLSHSDPLGRVSPWALILALIWIQHTLAPIVCLCPAKPALDSHFRLWLRLTLPQCVFYKIETNLQLWVCHWFSCPLLQTCI